MNLQLFSNLPLFNCPTESAAKDLTWEQDSSKKFCFGRSYTISTLDPVSVTGSLHRSLKRTAEAHTPALLILISGRWRPTCSRSLAPLWATSLPTASVLKISCHYAHRKQEAVFGHTKGIIGGCIHAFIPCQQDYKRHSQDSMECTEKPLC